MYDQCLEGTDCEQIKHWEDVHKTVDHVGDVSVFPTVTTCCMVISAEVMNSVLQQFLVGKEENGIFKFCGKDSDNTKTLASCHMHGQHRTSTADHLRCQARLDAEGYSRRHTPSEIRHTVSRLDRKANRT